MGAPPTWTVVGSCAVMVTLMPSAEPVALLAGLVACAAEVVAAADALAAGVDD
ncbi:hypothetical protein ACIRRA_02585 [Nocardia sp. NPDC101769]|uniref:hypothetical protein n=1 Tax=Nocardia sp. NPDC101769 TaxID=3364333 RepID=UPI003813B48C